MKAEIEHKLFVLDCQILLSALDSDLQDIWNNRYKSKQVSFLGEVDNQSQRQKAIIKVISDYYYYHTFYDDDSFIDCLEVVLIPQLGSNFSHRDTVEVNGTLKECKRVRNSDNQSSCTSILRIYLQDSSVEYHQGGIAYTCD